MKEILKTTLSANGIETGETELDSLVRYWEAVKERNKVMNLTAVTEDGEAAVKHFADSLKGAEYLRGVSRVLDLGSGAGFPGIPLAILLPDTEFLLMDSLRKRIGFLNEVISDIGLNNVTTLHARAEDAARTTLRESFDAVTARAVAPLQTLSEYALPFLKTGGKAYFYKGQDFECEVAASERALRELNGKILKNHEFLLNNGLFRVIIEILKTGKTPLKYPRGQNKPKTNPLG